MSQVSIGQLLVQFGYITESQLRSALAFQRGWDGRVGLEAALVKLGLLSASQVSDLSRLRAAEHQTGAAGLSSDPGARPAANEPAKDSGAAAA